MPARRILLIAALAAVSSLVATGAGVEHMDLEEWGDVPCTDCHGDLLEGAFAHPPAEAEECDSCHEFAGAGEETTVALTMPAEELCLACHENPAAESATFRHSPVADGGCALCHDPHSSGLDHLLLRQANDLCLDCHVDQGEELELAYVHGAVPSLGCPACHDPHAASAPSLLRRPGNVLCLECHLATSSLPAQDEGGRIPLFGTQSIDRSQFDSIPKVNLGPSTVGHPVAKHPVAAAEDPLQPGRVFWCGSCHPAHGAARKGLLVGEARGSFCFQCHRK